MSTVALESKWLARVGPLLVAIVGFGAGCQDAEPDASSLTAAVQAEDDDLDYAPQFITQGRLQKARAYPHIVRADAASSELRIPAARDLKRRDTLAQPGLRAARPRPSSVASSSARGNDHRRRQDPDGYIAYVDHRDRRNPVWFLRVAPVKDKQKQGRIYVEATIPLDSAAVSEDGNLVTFSATGPSGIPELFLLDVDGSIGGTPMGIFRLPLSPAGATNVSMSRDGAAHAFESRDAAGLANYFVWLLDRATGNIQFQPFNITLGGVRFDTVQPSVNPSGETVYFVGKGAQVDALFGAPIVIGFGIAGGGAIEYAGLPGSTTDIRDPSASEDGTRIMFMETFDGSDDLVFIFEAGLAVLLSSSTADHPYLAGDGSGFALSLDRAIFKAIIDFESGEIDFDPVADRPRPHAIRHDAMWARPLPPPPPPPPGQIRYEGTTVGGPTFHRPEGTGPATLPGLVSYHAFTFTPDRTAFWDFLSVQDYDGYLHLYRAPFDPAQPLANVLAGNDDFPSAPRSGFAVFLQAGVQYVLVTSAFEAGASGTFVNTITPRPAPAPGEAPRIEIAEATLSIADPGETIGFRFFVSSSDPVTCNVAFGDGATQQIAPCPTGTFVNLSHAYAAEGFYTVTITATAAGGSNVAKLFPTIKADDPDQFDIVVVFSNDLLTEGQKAAFANAAARWAEVVRGDLVGVSTLDGTFPAGFSCIGSSPFNGRIDDLVVSAIGAVRDGPGGVLASAGPCLFRDPGTNGALFPLPTFGGMSFDIADLANLEADGSLQDVVTHEMGHVLGIGSLWEADNLVTGTEDQGADPTSPDYDPVYIGEGSVAQYQALLEDAGLPLEVAVPIENSGGAGTRESHWREVTFDNELMTGFLNAGVNPLSTLTVSTLGDMGYAIDLAAADPYSLPGASARRAAPVTIGTDEVIRPKTR